MTSRRGVWKRQGMEGKQNPMRKSIDMSPYRAMEVYIIPNIIAAIYKYMYIMYGGHL